MSGRASGRPVIGPGEQRETRRRIVAHRRDLDLSPRERVVGHRAGNSAEHCTETTGGSCLALYANPLERPAWQPSR